MFKDKIKKFFADIKKSWKATFSHTEFDNKECKILSKAIANSIMDVDIEFRLVVLREVEALVLKATRRKVYELKKEQILILKKLKEYETPEV